jgi:hypothetical protein
VPRAHAATILGVELVDRALVESCCRHLSIILPAPSLVRVRQVLVPVVLEACSRAVRS